MLTASKVENTTGGVEVFVDATPDEVELLAETGRKFSMEAARAKGCLANVVSSEFGPFPINGATGAFCRDQESIKSASDLKQLVYRKKFMLTFVGG
jgi:hypothetical protein